MDPCFQEFFKYCFKCSDVCSFRDSEIPASYQRDAIETFILQQEKDSIDILVDQQKYFGLKNRTKDPKCEDVLSDYRALTGYQIFLSDFRLFYFLRIRNVLIYINRILSEKVKIQANKGIIL